MRRVRLRRSKLGRISPPGTDAARRWDAGLIQQIARHGTVQLACLMACVCKTWRAALHAKPGRLLLDQKRSIRFDNWRRDDLIGFHYDDKDWGKLVRRVLTSERAAEVRDLVLLFTRELADNWHDLLVGLHQLQHLQELRVSPVGVVGLRLISHLPNLTTLSIDLRAGVLDLMWMDTLSPNLVHLDIYLKVETDGKVWLHGDPEMGHLQSFCFASNLKEDETVIVAPKMSLKHAKQDLDLDMPSVLLPLTTNHPTCVCFGVHQFDETLEYGHYLIPVKEAYYSHEGRYDGFTI